MPNEPDGTCMKMSRHFFSRPASCRKNVMLNRGGTEPGSMMAASMPQCWLTLTAPILCYLLVMNTPATGMLRVFLANSTL